MISKRTRNGTYTAVIAAAMMCTLGVSDADASRGTSARGASRNNNSQTQRTNRQRARNQRTATPRAQRRSSSSALIIQSYKSHMESTIKGNATPPFMVVPTQSGVQMTQTRQGNYKQNITQAFSVQGVPSSGQLSMTALLPVSGHVSGQAANYAKTNRYNIVITHSDGSKQTLSKVPSTGFVTEHSMNIQLKGPGKTIVQMWPDGSGGVGGFKAGREIEIDWSGN